MAWTSSLVNLPHCLGESAKPARMSDIHSTASSDRRASSRARMRRLLLSGIAVLYVVSVPWYRETDAPLRVWFGLPDWVAVALGCYIGVAVLNAMAWRLTDIPDQYVEGQAPERSGK
jgi:hypothetical protein